MKYAGTALLAIVEKTRNRIINRKEREGRKNIHKSSACKDDRPVVLCLGLREVQRVDFKLSQLRHNLLGE